MGTGASRLERHGDYLSKFSMNPVNANGDTLLSFYKVSHKKWPSFRLEQLCNYLAKKSISDIFRKFKHVVTQLTNCSQKMSLLVKTGEGAQLRKDIKPVHFSFVLYSRCF